MDAVVDCTGQTTREINRALKRLAAEGAPEIRVLHPGARHCLGVAMFDPVKIRFEGSVGYLCCTLGDGADFEVMGEAGWLTKKDKAVRDAGIWPTDYMFALGLIIGGGTAQIQKNIIAEAGLGMPRGGKSRK